MKLRYTMMVLMIAGSLNAYAEKPKTTSKTNGKVVEKTVETSAEKAAEKAVKAAKKSTGKATEKSTEKADKKTETETKTVAVNEKTTPATTNERKRSKKASRKKTKNTAAPATTETKPCACADDKKTTENPTNSTPKTNKTETPSNSKKHPTIVKQEVDITSVYRLNFASPSQNIICGGDVLPTYGGAKGVSCYIKKMDNLSKMRKLKPASCTDNWGQVFELGRTGKSRMACYTDTPYSQKPKTLAYGQMVKSEGWHCTSLVQGMKCVNKQGNGFELSREKQILF